MDHLHESPDVRCMAHKPKAKAVKTTDREQKLRPDDPTLVKIRKLRDQMELVQEDLAERAKKSVSYISRLESGKTDPTLTDLRHISVALEIPLSQLVSEDGASSGHSRSVKPTKIFVEGEVAAGRYVEFHHGVRVDFERFESPFPPDPNYPYAAQFDLRVSGTSLNKFAKEGEFLRCVHLLKSEEMKQHIEIFDGDYVIFERSKGSLLEVTAKKFVRRADQIELWPDSDDPQWQTPTIIPLTEETDGEEGRVVALVLYTYKPTRRR